MNKSDNDTPNETKRRYTGPAIVDVGKIDTVTMGHSEPVGDPPHDGTTGYYNSAGRLELEVDPEGQ